MITKEQHHQEWTARIADYKTSGFTMSAWCDVHHVKKRAVEVLAPQTKINPFRGWNSFFNHWMPLTVTDPIQSTIPTSSLVVSIGSVHIEIHPGFDPWLL